MDKNVRADLQVTSTVLRTLYQQFYSEEVGNLIDLSEIAGSITVLVDKLIDLLSQNPQEYVEIQEIFEDVVALFWQLAWLLYANDSYNEQLLEALKGLSNIDSNSKNLVYEVLATEVILQNIDRFPSGVEWQELYEELDQKVQNGLHKIDSQIIEFAKHHFPSWDERKQSLLGVFFDCYWGFKQGNHIPDSDPYAAVIREPWQRRFRKFKSYEKTGYKFLCTYSGGMDISMRLNSYWLSRAVEKIATAEQKSPEYLTRELGEYLQIVVNEPKLPTCVETPSDFLKALLGYIKITSSGINVSSKIDICNDIAEDLWDLIDLINEIGRVSGAVEELGGAAVTGANALIKLEEVHNNAGDTEIGEVHLLLPFIPHALIEKLDSKLQILWYDKKGIVTCNPQDLLNKIKTKNLEHPQIRNFVIEFSSKSPIVYCSCCGASVLPCKTDRLITRNRFAYYKPDGRIERNETHKQSNRTNVRGLFGFDSRIGGSLPDKPEKLAKRAAANGYDLIFLSGLQSLDQSVQATVHEELKALTSGTTKVHIEVSGTKNLDWLCQVIPEFVDSVSIGEELESLFQVVKQRSAPEEQKYLQRVEEGLPSASRGYRNICLAQEVSRLLTPSRLYVHDEDLDIIICPGNLEQTERLRQIRAALVAKWVVLRKLMARGQITADSFRDTMTQVKEEGFTVLTEAAQAIYERFNLSRSAHIELFGAYFPDYDQTVMLVPIRWVYGTIQDQLRIIGGGDTTSFVSAAQAITVEA